MNLAKIKTWARHAFSALVIIGLVFYLWQHREDVVAGLSLSFGYLSALAALIMASWVLNSLPMLIFVRLMQRRIGFWENVAVLVAGGLGNYLPMRIGTVIRMRYFKKAHDLSYTAFVGIMGVRTLLLLTLTGILGCGGLVGLMSTGQEVPVFIVLVFAAMALLPMLAIYVPLQFSNENRTYWGRLQQQLAAGHSILRDNPAALRLLILIMLVQFAVLGLRLFISFQMFGIELSVWTLMLLGPATTLVTFVSITPGNLGFREWIIGILAIATGLDFQSGVFAGTLDRSVLMLLTFTIGPICLYYTLRRTNNENGDKAIYPDKKGPV